MVAVWREGVKIELLKINKQIPHKNITYMLDNVVILLHCNFSVAKIQNYIKITYVHK